LVALGWPKEFSSISEETAVFIHQLFHQLHQKLGLNIAATLVNKADIPIPDLSSISLEAALICCDKF